MSSLLWSYFHNEEVEKFRALLSQSQQYAPKGYIGGAGNPHNIGSIGGSPGGFGSSPRNVVKGRKVSGQYSNLGSAKGTNLILTRAEINGRDHAGLTLLHRAASSTSENAISFAMALLEHPTIDLYVQDTENGWTALHRALYFGNVTIARAIIEKDCRDPGELVGNAVQRATSSVIKAKDHEGNSPFDVYNATIARRTLQRPKECNESEEGSQDEAEQGDSDVGLEGTHNQPANNGEEVWSWGSNRNFGLGFKDEDDRQHPERISLKRPDHLLFRFYREHQESILGAAETTLVDFPRASPKTVSELPTLITNRPIVIQDVSLSKLHSAILTTDPEANLHMCGFGPGGRLGTGDEITRFSYTCIQEGSLAGKKISSIALGQNHTLALTSDGEIASFGTNTFGQLGYTLPRPTLKDEEPICSTPRQIFGPLKRERVIGVAASAIHSVAHTSASLFTWGKNEGQLGLMDSDSRSLKIQTVPRKVAASLFKASINMVSAINGATIVLLANHTVCVFTNYGYNIVRFPLDEGFTNYHLQSNALTTRYGSVPNHISHITAGGDTIAAVSSRGDLFTVIVRKLDTNPSTSTTNPSKIRDSLSPPQRVWSLRKGNWDGIKSASITENGAVIVCTHAGAVWRRLKRAKTKDAFVGTGYNRKDFKFQRIPGLTNVIAVRSTPFGVYSAIRKDCDVTRTQVAVTEQQLWSDIAPLLSIGGLEPSELFHEEDTETPRFWAPTLPKDLLDPMKRAVLTSPDLEADVSRHLIGQDLNGYDFTISTSTSEVEIPVHGFILARSPVLRKALREFGLHGEFSVSELLTIKLPTLNNDCADTKGSLFGNSHAPPVMKECSPVKGKLVVQGLDFLTIFNLIVYLYTDTVIDVWHFTRHCPKMAFRYRQVRVELMKIAAHLKMTKLESAVRLMTEPERQMAIDMSLAIQEPGYFDEGDTIVELDGGEAAVNRALLCRRCPFFEGLFNGRAGGQWLASRRQDENEPIRIDLKHVQPEIFKIVLRYIYADVGTEVFDEFVSADIDEFSELVMDVMAVANELMLDRLSQICQEVIGRFVNTRNACHLLNAIAPCSVTEFKDAALEYLCLQLEAMLENHLLNDLEADLLLELDEVVRGNQLNCLPFAKSGRAELLLHERHPSLAEDIHKERQRRLRDMAFRNNLKDDEGRLSSSYKARVGSLEDLMSASPTNEKGRRKIRISRNTPFSPSIRPKDSTADLMFDMDDDNVLNIGSPRSPALKPMLRKPSAADPTSRPNSSHQTNLKSIMTEEQASPLHSSPLLLARSNDESPGPKTWSPLSLPSSRFGMQEIMYQASSSRTSALSMGISAQKAKAEISSTEEAPSKVSTPKLSQKERKKQQQQRQAPSEPEITLNQSDGKPSSPWQIASKGLKTSLKDVLKETSASSPVLPVPILNDPIQNGSATPRRTASPDTRFSGQRRKVNNRKSQYSSSSPSLPVVQLDTSMPIPVMPQSKSYIAPSAKAEPSLQLSMADIIGQQRREQEVVKEAVAKRSLQEIQEEQAFQEWWDQETKRTQDEEAARSKTPAPGPVQGSKSGPGRGKLGKGRGKGISQIRGRGRGQENASNSSH